MERTPVVFISVWGGSGCNTMSLKNPGLGLKKESEEERKKKGKKEKTWHSHQHHDQPKTHKTHKIPDKKQHATRIESVGQPIVCEKKRKKKKKRKKVRKKKKKKN